MSGLGQRRVFQRRRILSLELTVGGSVCPSSSSYLPEPALSAGPHLYNRHYTTTTTTTTKVKLN